jgi:hypothetical protein
MTSLKYSAAVFFVIAGLTQDAVGVNSAFAASSNPPPSQGNQSGGKDGGYQGDGGNGQSSARLSGRRLQRCLDDSADLWLDRTYSCHGKFSGNRLRNCLSNAYTLYLIDQAACRA